MQISLHIKINFFHEKCPCLLSATYMLAQRKIIDLISNNLFNENEEFSQKIGSLYILIKSNMLNALTNIKQSSVIKNRNPIVSA